MVLLSVGVFVWLSITFSRKRKHLIEVVDFFGDRISIVAYLYKVNWTKCDYLAIWIMVYFVSLKHFLSLNNIYVGECIEWLNKIKAKAIDVFFGILGEQVYRSKIFRFGVIVGEYRIDVFSVSEGWRALASLLFDVFPMFWSLYRVFARL